MGGRRHQQKSANLRQLVADEAARIILDEGIRDYYQAKSRAAERLGISGRFSLPRNTEIESALRIRQALFDGDVHLERLASLRQAALEAMEFFKSFDPRLVGPVLDGTADEFSAVCLHLFADTPESVQLYLDEHQVPYDEVTRSIRVNRSQSQSFPVYVFEAGGTPLDVMVLPRDSLRQAPLSPVNGRPMQRASSRAVSLLLDSGEPQPV